MRTLMLSTIAVWLITLLVTLAPWNGHALDDGRHLIRSALILALVPACTAWIALEAAQRLRPRRLLDPRLRRPIARMIAGATIGLVGLVLAAVALPFLDTYCPDVLVVSFTSFSSAGFVGFCLPAIRSDACLFCGYDLRGAVPGAQPRCPECGHLVT